MSEAGSVLVVCAMESEAVHLRAMLADAEEIPLARWRRSRGRLGAVEVDLVVCGIGLALSAAATAAACIDRRPFCVLNYGCAGAHRADIDAGDVIVARSIAHLASYIHQPDGTKHLFGFRTGDEAEGPRHLDQLPADGSLVEAAQIAGSDLQLPAWPGGDHAPRIYEGPVGSADIWTQHTETIQQLHLTHGTLCEDMEAAAIAPIAALFDLPFLAIKDISNNELQKSTEFDGADSGSQLLDDVVDQVGLRAAILTAATVAQIDLD